MVTGSVSSNVLTFTKGDGSTFNLTVAATASSAESLVTASISDATITFTKGNASTFPITVNNVSNASTASFTPNALVTASVSSNTITFTKGDGTTFPITVNTGSGGGSGSAFPFTGSAQITGSLSVTGSTVVIGNFSAGASNNVPSGAGTVVVGGTTNITSNLQNGGIFTGRDNTLTGANDQGMFIIGGQSHTMDTNGTVGTFIIGGNGNTLKNFAAGAITTPQFDLRECHGGILGGIFNFIDNAAGGPGQNGQPIIIGGRSNGIIGATTASATYRSTIINSSGSRISQTTGSTIIAGTNNLISGSNNVTLIGINGRTTTVSNTVYVSNLDVSGSAGITGSLSVNSTATFNSTSDFKGNAVFSGSVIVEAGEVLTLVPINPLPTGVATGSFAVSASAPPKPYFYDGTNWNALY
jgi:hypothetical protein